MNQRWSKVIFADLELCSRSTYRKGVDYSWLSKRMTSSILKSNGSRARMRVNGWNYPKKFVRYYLKRGFEVLSERNRPRGVTILVILEFVLGILLLIGTFRRSFQAAAIFLMIFAVVSFCLGVGLWTGKSWAWLGGIGLAVFGIILSVFVLFVRPTIGEGVYLILNIVIIYFLIQPRIQRCFDGAAV